MSSFHTNKTKTMPEQYDILVLGGGPAGYTAAIHATRREEGSAVSVALIEPLQLGGTCLNRGCIPTKTLVETAHYLDLFAEASQRGIDWQGSATINPAKAFQYKDRIVKRMNAGVGILMRENGITVKNARAALDFTEGEEFPFTAALSGPDGEDLGQVRARKVILATGARPARPPIPGLADPALADRILTSDQLLDPALMPEFLKREIPPRLAILGGGIIGIEVARIFRSFGSEVHVIEALPRLASALDEEISEALAKALKAKKVKLSLSKTLERVEPAASGLTLCFPDGETLEVSHLLVAVGRSPCTEMLSESLRQRLKPNRQGFLPVDEWMKTLVPGLFAPGDVNGKCQLAHAAMEMGRLAALAALEELNPEVEPFGEEEISESALEEYRRRIMEKDDKSPLPDMVKDFFPFYIPSCIYGEPEAGSIGWTEAHAREKLGDAIQVGRFPFAANGRAAAAGHREGFVKVIRLKERQSIVGVHIVGPCASELINEVSAIMYAGGNIDQWAASIHAHPTYGEALVEAAADSLGQALHLPPKRPL